ncbi:acetate kinase [Colwellia chukchiensis]|uniref:Acetate kinase n=1 Tax=Colwellia chukchiensis TaxID=641665 RepID=A0A1H7NSK1_9GAMM|nr:acetate kinase [Colwellia chukchiensis]SEL26028.1 acetate kinase [Colwellia chukchiensis]
MQNKFILVLNCGSSSLKFSLIDPELGTTLLSGLAQRLLSEQASIKIHYNASHEQQEIAAPYDHQAAILVLVKQLQQLNLISCVKAVGHRVVHGGESYCQPTLINADVKAKIKQLARLAPLHNPANLTGIEAAESAFPELAQVAIFDTAFHQTMPEKAYIYGIPYALYKHHGIRRYGFHGTSHYFVAQQAAERLEKPLAQCSFISAHLGNGCSIAAIKNGKSVDTSLGMTPLEGVMMGTRSGDLDPGIIFYLINQLGYSVADVEQLLNKESGLLGISELSNDCRIIEDAYIEAHNQQAGLALDVFCYRIAKAIAAFTASLTQLDGIIFTGGIGENSNLIREKIISQLSLLNFEIAPDANVAMRFGQSGLITREGSRPAWVIATNEEWVIAEQTFQLLNEKD